MYNFCCEMNSNSLEKLQRRAAQRVCKSKDSGCAMDILKRGTLLKRREHRTFDIVATRQSDHLHLPTVRTEVAKRSF